MLLSLIAVGGVFLISYFFWNAVINAMASASSKEDRKKEERLQRDVNIRRMEHELGMHKGSRDMACKKCRAVASWAVH